ncbi:MAG: GGDEF domain-containing protein [Lachnospiraceae bacterium]|nr:GGDEF domain-containing protein [Lachnospiraceae bacterium]
MTELITKIKEFFSGNLNINEKIKYAIICNSLAVIHFFFLIVFYIYGVTPLFIYNIFAVLMYLYCGLYLSKRERFSLVFALIIIEIVFHSSLATFLLNWNYGFMIYTIALVPVAYYMAFTIEGVRRSLELSAIASFSIFVVYFAITYYSRHSSQIYTPSGRLESIFFYLNNMLAFVLAISFSVLFIIEISHMQRNLRSENISLEEQANYDKLTHLLNRNAMTKYFEDAIALSERDNKDFCILMLDIDDFKKVNDTYGHDCGDEVLKTVARVITDDVRQGDAVFRWGGEEIVVLIRSDLKVATSVAHRICNHIAGAVTTHQNKNIKVTITIGVAAFIKGMTMDELIKQADVKLYYGKKHGKDQVVS